MERFEVGFMHHMKVAVNLNFGVKDLSAFRAHVLSCPCLGGTFAFSGLAQTCTSKLEKEKILKLRVKIDVGLVCLFFFVFFAFFNEFADSRSTFCAAFASCLFNRHFAFACFRILFFSPS